MGKGHVRVRVRRRPYALGWMQIAFRATSASQVRMVVLSVDAVGTGVGIGIGICKQPWGHGITEDSATIVSIVRIGGGLMLAKTWWGIRGGWGAGEWAIGRGKGEGGRGKGKLLNE